MSHLNATGEPPDPYVYTRPTYATLVSPPPLKKYGDKYINVSRVSYAERRGTRLWIYFAGGSYRGESLTFSSATETFLDGEAAEEFLRDNAEGSEG